MTGEGESRSRAIEAHLPLVRNIAQRYSGRGEPVEDLVQVGTIGLIKAVDRFDPSRGRSLSALARPSIESEIRLHLRYIEDRSQAEIASELGLSQAHVSRLLRAALEHVRCELDGETPPGEPA